MGLFEESLGEIVNAGADLHQFVRSSPRSDAWIGVDRIDDDRVKRDLPV
jgi:hypothetical protein